MFDPDQFHDPEFRSLVRGPPSPATPGASEVLRHSPPLGRRPGRVVATIRLVFQFPASITSVVDAPRLVSSDASLTRPEWAVTGSTPAARAAALESQPHHLRQERHDLVLGRRARGGP